MSNIKIDGVERTQATQFFLSASGQGSGYSPNNSVPLVARKPTLLRVYASFITGLTLIAPKSLSGSLVIQSNTGPVALSPINAAITAQPEVDINRGDLSSTLNFEIPLYYAEGSLPCSLKVFDPANPQNISELNFILYFTKAREVNFTILYVNYNGVNFFDQPVNAQPDGFDAMEALTSVLDIFPVGEFNFLGCKTLNWSKKIAVKANIEQLFSTVQLVRALSFNPGIYIALMPPEAGCGSTCGLGTSGTALCFARDPKNICHEVGHAFGRPHAPCGNPGGPDQSYPTYGSYPMASIGEFGVRVRTRTIYDPQTSTDVLGYCDQNWISPHNYLAVLYAIQNGTYSGSSPFAGKPASVWSARVADFYHLSFCLDFEDDDLEKPTLVSWSGVHAVRPPPLRQRPWDARVVADLIDANGTVLDSYPCVAAEPNCGCNFDESGPSWYSVDFPNYSEMQQIRIRRDRYVIRKLTRSLRPPKIVIKGVKIRDTAKGAFASVAWQVWPNSDGASVQIIVRYSPDGERWQVVEVAPKKSQCIIKLDDLPGGKNCRIEVLASEGLQTATARSTPFKVAVKKRGVWIHKPSQGDRVDRSELHLIGAAFSPDFGQVSPEDLRWYDDKNAPIGIGNTIAIDVGKNSTTKVSLRAPDGMGSETEAIFELKRKSRKQ